MNRHVCVPTERPDHPIYPLMGAISDHGLVRYLGSLMLRQCSSKTANEQSAQRNE